MMIIRALILLILSLYSYFSYSQTKDSIYMKQLELLLDEYKINSDDNQVIQPKLFNENLDKAFNTVVFSSSDLVSNASAFGYTQNEEKTTITTNANFQPERWERWYLKFGINATGSNGIFKLYSDDSWSNKVGGSLGIIYKSKKAGTYFKPDPAEFEKDQKMRKIFMSESLYNKKLYSEESDKNIKTILKRIEENDSVDVIEEDCKEFLKLIPKANQQLTNHEYLDAYKTLDSIQKEIKLYLDNTITKTSGNEKHEKLKSYIKEKLVEYDKTIDKTYGYYFWWFDANISLDNSTYNFKESTDEEILPVFNNSDDLSYVSNKLKTILSVNANYTRNEENTILYIQFGPSYQSGSFLESSLIQGTPEITLDNNDNLIIQDEEGQEIGDFSQIKENLQTGQLNAYGAIFFTAKKNFGVNGSFQHEYLIEKPNNTYFGNNFSLFLGPVFRKPAKKDGGTALTFGIDLGWDHALYKTKISDDFIARLRIGIPFAIYTKKKS